MRPSPAPRENLAHDPSAHRPLPSDAPDTPLNIPKPQRRPHSPRPPAATRATRGSFSTPSVTSACAQQANLVGPAFATPPRTPGLSAPPPLLLNRAPHCGLCYRGPVPRRPLASPRVCMARLLLETRLLGESAKPLTTAFGGPGVSVPPPSLRCGHVNPPNPEHLRPLPCLLCTWEYPTCPRPLAHPLDLESEDAFPQHLSPAPQHRPPRDTSPSTRPQHPSRAVATQRSALAAPP